MWWVLTASPLVADEPTEPGSGLLEHSPRLCRAGALPGLCYELGQEVMRRLGYQSAIQVQPLARANRTVQ